MCNNFTRTERIIVEDGKLWRYMYANGFLVARCCEDGTQLSRNIDYCGMFGWRFAEPGRKYTDYSGTYTAVADEWGKYTPRLDNFCYGVPMQQFQEKILEVYPGFRWIMQKADYTTSQLFKAISIWKKYPREMETLCSIGFSETALNGSFYRSRERKELTREFSRHPEWKYLKLQDIQLMRKYGVGIDAVERYRSEVCRKYAYVNFDEWRYLHGQDAGARYYNDYKEMVVKAGHDLNDPYWKYPKNLERQHNKVLRECRRIDRLRDEERNRKIMEDYTKAIKKFIGKNIEIGKYAVRIPETVKEFERQAKALNQCLMSCDYMTKVSSGKCIIVMVYKGGKPYATCELLKLKGKFKVGQFYGDEGNIDYKAKPDAVEAFNKWAEKFLK